MNNQRLMAIITGASLILMAIVAIFSIGYAYTQFDTPNQTQFLKNNILENKGLYQSMLLGILIVIILDFIVSYTSYKYFEEDHGKIAKISGIIRAIYSVVFGIATYFLFKNLTSKTKIYNL